MSIRGALGDAVGWLEPRPRVVDWSLFALVLVETVTGFVSFTVGVPGGWPVFWVHRIAGLGFVLVLGYKLKRVAHRLTRSEKWTRSTPLSVLTALAAVGTLATGIVWVFGLDVRVSYWTLLSVHVGFGLALLALVPLHMSTRFRLPRSRDFEGRRTALQYTGMLVAGALAYRLQEALNGLLSTHGDDRRFTGSQPRLGPGNAGFPITMWVADDPDRIDTDDYRLEVTGLVESPVALTADDVAAGDERRALLDCTSGWYTVQDWSGSRVGDLLEAAGGTTEDGEWVRFVSVTGYRWSLPIEEAEDALLATHVGGERLTHGHGAPVRLVAPPRRGFQWVKWVTRVEVRTHNDPAQWLVTLVSGFD